MKEPKNITIAWVLVKHLVIWPIAQLLLSVGTLGLWIPIGLLLQLVDIVNDVRLINKRKEWERKELLNAIAAQKNQ